MVCAAQFDCMNSLINYLIENCKPVRKRDRLSG
jgi:hypothetical protein